MLFSDVLAGARLHGGVGSAGVSEDWLQGRSLFGGMQSALALHAMRQLVPADVPLRVLQTTFAAPVPAGEVGLRATVLRTGKNVTHVEARILQGDETAALLTGVFGRARPSRVQRAAAVAPSDPEPARGPERSPGVAFAQHFRIRQLRGDPPRSGSRRPDALFEVEMKDAGATTVTEEHVVAIADVPPPLAAFLLETPTVGSSMTWTLEMLEAPPAGLSLAGWQLHVELTAARDGYTSQSVLVCAAGGRPVALSRQSMVVFG